MIVVIRACEISGITSAIFKAGTLGYIARVKWGIPLARLINLGGIMTPVIAKMVQAFQIRNEELEKEVAVLKQRLQYSHTTINDLRYSKKLLHKIITDLQLQQSA